MELGSVAALAGVCLPGSSGSAMVAGGLEGHHSWLLTGQGSSHVAPLGAG